MRRSRRRRECRCCGRRRRCEPSWKLVRGSPQLGDVGSPSLNCDIALCAARLALPPISLNSQLVDAAPPRPRACRRRRSPSHGFGASQASTADELGAPARPISAQHRLAVTQAVSGCSRVASPFGEQAAEPAAIIPMRGVRRSALEHAFSNLLRSCAAKRLAASARRRARSLAAHLPPTNILSGATTTRLPPRSPPTSWACCCSSSSSAAPCRAPKSPMHS